MGKLTAVVDGKRRIVSNPPLVVRLDDMIELEPDVVGDRLGTLFASYRMTLQSDRQRLLGHFAQVDIAHKVVGVGSVGTRA
jgi:Uncharacterized protein conserved in bacteria (DUF2252)